jgi:hypothetical protein
VDYFLFDLKRGYCDYYATAMAMLARAAGLPARIAVGYAAGSYDADTHTYRVTEASAHSWTQVYFPAYGWVDFEPTSGRETVALDAANTNLPTQREHPTEDANSFPSSAQRSLAQFWFVVPVLIVLAGLIVPGCFLVDTLVLRRAAPMQMIRMLYGRVVGIARLVGLPLSSGLTPNQISALLESEFTAAAGPRTLRLWRPISAVLHLIVSEYMQITYGAQETTNVQAARVIQNWHAVRFSFALLVLWHILKMQGKRLRLLPKAFVASARARRFGD